MVYLAHEVEMLTPAKDGAANRAHYEQSARMGGKGAQKLVEVPDFPDSHFYLYDWSYELHGRDGAGMGGLNPLSYTTIESWSRLKDVHIEPHEAAALISLNAVMLNAARGGDDEKPAGTKEIVRPVWPAESEVIQ